MTPYLLACAIFVVAAFAQSVSGFGFALVAVPLLALTTEPALAVVAAGAVSLAMVSVTALAERRHVDLGAARSLFLASIAGMPLGLLVLLLLPSALLTGVIAVVTLGCTAFVWRGRRMAGGIWRVRLAGLLSGVLLTSTGTNGPPLVAALHGLRLGPREFRATIAAIFMTSGVVGMAGFALAGVITADTALVAGLGLPAAGLGGWLGNRLFVRFDATRFRRVILSALVISSAAALANAATRL